MCKRYLFGRGADGNGPSFLLNKENSEEQKRILISRASGIMKS